ncbi:hypothetical protein P154DRAFT_556023 [Amniculicola lignicola CBS 123094]|uniref:Uncharacterized protein n=1 Tax=Amniculicola lignicola CBS 123094 TaxID=1392246 RepID=A0A6A5W6U2_9PLEO|nr:hypothetical protein P154DRAFT_556023 [Amniculicola lignicola CBS 123094]
MGWIHCDMLNTSTWTYCGPLIPPTTTSLPSSFHTWSASTIHGPFLDRLLPFLSFLHTFLPASGVHHYWLTIRVTKPTTEFDTVRWHADDIFFDKTGERGRTISSPSPAQPHPQSRPSSVLPSWTKRKPPQKEYWKLVTTLLGPGTLFLKDGASARRIQKEAKRMVCAKRGPHTCSSFKCLGCLDAIESVRLILAEQFAQADVEATKYGEVAFFRLGDDEGAIHSEPKCDEDRIFINVVPGAEDELAELMDRWGLVYPRDWSFGVPMEWRGTEGWRGAEWQD